MEGPRTVYNLLEMSYADVQEWLKKTDVILVPFGSCERHGAHIPLGTDSLHTYEVTVRAAKKANVPHTPLEPYGYSPHHMHSPGFGAGTVTLRANTVKMLVNDVARSLVFHGFNKIIFVAAHGSYSQVIEPAIRALKYKTGGFFAWYKPFYERDVGPLKGILENPPEETPGWHSSEMETSQVMAVRPDLVNMKRAVKELAHAPKWLGAEFTKPDGVRQVKFKGSEAITLAMEHYEYSDSATIGNPFRASAEKGEKIYEAQSDHLAAFAEVVKTYKIVARLRDWPERAM
jgi:creatinine amidohydrolase